MEKSLNQYHMENMKMAILKHEETFREQVYELHRVYQTQKMLMKNIAKQTREEEVQRDQDYCNKRIRENSVVEDEKELELTLGPSCYNPIRKKAFYDSAVSFSSSSSSTERRGKESGSSRSELKWGNIELPPALNQSFLRGGGGQRTSNVPQWHFQAALSSLNMT